ncbi:hypothetical protein NA57DRAFT_50680 [Rhizodiscina lignyota]|uniref:BZIP domain-containing protein n=1 Tax=Rhizodiscina lignyota TaxID=1504668 RepID=A0A9P4MDU6_9PEZI|nr:hypothetical protein NA57DRAFT_50680 [Rhizodiscina lignyota]
MPRKASTTAPAVRIRENQRRARARRKELIDDLKIRIRNYETQGITATAQVQKAAQKVLLENRGLRALLAEKGVLPAEIEAFLHGCHYDASFTAALQTPEPVDIADTRSQAASSVDLQQSAETHASDATNQLVSAASTPAAPMDIECKSASEAGKDGEFTASSPDTELRCGEQPEEDLERGSPLPNFLGPVSDCYCPDIESVAGQAQSSETECSVAANILAGFRGHGDIEQARAELGCPDTAQCSITNAALLHALDSEHASNTPHAMHMSR